MVMVASLVNSHFEWTGGFNRHKKAVSLADTGTPRSRSRSSSFFILIGDPINYVERLPLFSSTPVGFEMYGDRPLFTR